MSQEVENPLAVGPLTVERMEELLRLHPRDLADQLETLPVPRIRDILRKLPDEVVAELIPEFSVDLNVELFEAIKLQNLSGILNEMFADDAADVLGHLSAARLQEIMATIPADYAAEIRSILQYPEDSAGGIMRTEYLCVREDMTLGEAVDHLQQTSEEYEGALFYVYVTDSRSRLRGVLKVRDLLFRKPFMKVKDVMLTEVRAISAHADQEEIASLFRRYHFVALPVVDDYQRLVGIVTGDDILQVIQEEDTEDMHRMVGLTGDEVPATPWVDSVKNRLPWLMLNLLTAFLAGWVVSLFEDTIAKYAVLAIFLPIIAGQGGNAGCQTLTILVRALALGQTQIGSQRKILAKEIMVGLVTGLATGLVVGFVAWLWHASPVLGVVAFLAMVLNMLAAAFFGVAIPLGLKAIKVDPALASTIMLTTVTDVFGFFSFLGLAAFAFHYYPM